MKQLFLHCILYLLFSQGAFAQETPPPPVYPDSLSRQRAEEERRMMDPALGRVPYERLTEEREKLRRPRTNPVTNRAAIPGMTWQERGPANGGGRTRAALFDPNDPTRKKVWVGSPMGGLWYTDDITDPNATWTPVSDAWENMVVTTIAADPANPQIMYAGTGGDYSSVAGGGIWKTSNGGTTWTRLNSSIPGGAYPSVGQSLAYIQRIVVNASGHVFVAGRYGVVRSADGGGTWQTVLAPNQGIGNGGTATSNYFSDFVSDLEIGTDGIVYAAFNPGRVFRATTTAGTAWTEITPGGVPPGGERTELALAASTSGAGQVVYAVSRAYNNITYSQDTRWFRKSMDGGSNWTVVAIPGQNGRHFTDGNGGSALSLVVDPATPSVIYAGGYEWFRSVDGGVTWSTRLTTTNAYQHGLITQPGSPANAVLVNEQGVYWATGWGDAAVSAAPTLLKRSAGYRVGNVTSAAMKPAPGGPYLLNTTNESGTSTITGSGLSVGTPVFGFLGGNSAGRTFIDENEPGFQVFSSYNAWYRFDGVAPTYLFGLSNYTFLNPAAYDSQSNRLYVVESVNSAYAVKRVTGLTGTIVSTSFALPGSPDVIQLGSDQTSLLAGFYNSLLVKYTNLSQTTPTATTLATNSVLPGNAYISGIDVGATDNELLVTLSNYGVASVWYTSNGGTTWVNKDAAGSGLPDVPVRMGLFNPQNRQQVILATDLGIWTTNDITATNPGWELSNAGMPLIRINQLRYRASDGRLIAATAGRGIFETNAFAIAYTPSAIALTDVTNASLCAGNPLSVSFTTSGPAFGGAVTYDVWVSDANGSFAAQRRIGTGTGSPITVTLPTGSNALPFGANYRVRVVAPNLDITSGVSNALTIGNPPMVRITDRSTSPWYTSNTSIVCPGDPVRLSAATTSVGGGSAVADTYQWLLNGAAIAGATSQTYLTGVAGGYQVQVQQTGCTAASVSYFVQHPSFGITLDISSRFRDLPQCEDTPATLVAQYVGEQAAMQWVRNGADIAGATSGTYVAAQSGAYSYRITRAGCNAFPVVSNVTLGRSLAALMTPLSGDTVLCGGALKGDVYFNVANISSSQMGNGGYSVAWYRDNVPTNQSLNQTFTSVNRPGRYTYELRQGTCVTRSNAIVITEGSIASPLIQVGSPDDTKAACPGDSRLIYTAGGVYNTYQWQRDGIDIPSATQSGYNVQLTGSYTVRTTKGSCAAASPPFSLTFSNALRPQIRLSGGAIQACNELYLYGYQAVNASNVTYRWLKDGTPITGGTGDLLSVTQAGLYSLSVTSGACTGLSKPIYMRPNTIRKPTILVNAPGTVVCANNAVRLSMVSSRGSAQWKRNGVAVSTGNPSSFYATQPGLYTVQETTSCGVAESDPVEVKIGETTSAALSGGAFVSSGQVAKLPVLLSGPAPWSFTLSNGQSVQSTYLNPHMVSVSATATTTYTVSGVENACGTGTSAGQAVVTVGSGQADLSVLTQVSNRAPAVDEIVTYSLQISNAGPNNAANVQITNRLPVGMAFVDAQSPGISAVSGVVSGIVGTVPVDQPVTVSYRVRITQPGIYFTAAEVTATSTPDPDSQPNSGTGDGQDDAATVDLRTAEAGGGAVNSPNPGQVRLPPVISRQPPVPTGQVELSLAMRSSTIAPKVGEAVNLSVVVTNRGALTATYVVVQVVLPPGWAVTNGAGFVVTGQTVQAYIYQLPAGSPQVLVLPLQANGAGSATLHAHLLEVTEPTANATPGNGFQNGERDEASLLIQVR